VTCVSLGPLLKCAVGETVLLAERRIRFVAICWVAAAACGGGATPVGPSSPTVNGVQVSAASSLLAPGESAQVTATASFSSGATQIVTNDATWSVANVAVATVASGGRVTAVADGTTEIQATYRGISGSVTLQVKSSAPAPARVFTLCGTVTESGAAPVPRANLEVRDGLNAHRITDADEAGRYCLRDLMPDSFTLRIGKGGYDILDRGVTLSGDLTLDIVITPIRVPTFSLCGVVIAAINDEILPGARLEVRDGVNAGQGATAGASGRYCLPNLQGGSFTVRASRAGYDAVERVVSLSADATAAFALRVARGTISIEPANAVRPTHVVPTEIVIAVGESVRFVNNDSKTHAIFSYPHESPTPHTDCPEINNVGALNPGTARQTLVFTTAMTCWYHDDLDFGNGFMSGSIVIIVK
jgi:hypothetical protein